MAKESTFPLWLRTLIFFCIVLVTVVQCLDDEDESEVTKKTSETKKVKPIDDINTALEIAQKFKVNEKAESNLELMVDLEMIESLSITYLKYDTLNSPAIKEKKKELKYKIINLQKGAFPKLRDSWLRIHKSTFWENNIKVKKINSSSVMFISGVFANNKNIKDFHEGVYDMLEALRFKRISYKWVDIDVEYTYFDIKSPKDEGIE